MPPYADIYMLTKTRNEDSVSAFLERFAPLREETAVDYGIPQHVDSPHTTFLTAVEVVAYCCEHTSEPYSVYWRRLGDGDPAYAMVFFTSDGFLILGLSTEEGTAKRCFAELLEHNGSDIGYVTIETPPPETATEFRRFAEEQSA
jgi:hypothetical protein